MPFKFKYVLSLIIIFCFALSAQEASAQKSILDTLLRSKAAIVSVTAENSDIFKSPVRSVGIDPKSGRMMAVRKVAQASLERNGTGIIIHPSGVIVTNAHIIYKANRIKVTLYDSTTAYAKIIHFINDLDLALLKINPPYPLTRIAIADSDKLQLGDSIFTIGNSFILNRTVSEGKIRGLGVVPAVNAPGAKEIRLIQTSFDVYKGDSGGPIFDKNGKLIGLMTAKELSEGHSSFAIPSNEILGYLLDYINSGR